MKNAVIIALDFATKQQTLEFLAKFKQPLFVKVGMELYLQNGPQLLNIIKELGHKIFLDLKLHDIPNTIYQATKGLAKFDIDILTVHAAGGREMMEAAMHAIIDTNKKTKIIAITQLTSTSESQMKQEQNIQSSLIDSVINYATLAYQARVDGVVSSAQETSLIRKATDNDFLIINPGIRLAQDQANDQSRIATPEQARQNGADYIVVGRPITQQPDPKERYNIFNQLFNK